MSCVANRARWRPAFVAAALVGLVACQDREPNWEAFAISQYVDLAVGYGGRDEHGWVIVEGRRANQSCVSESTNNFFNKLSQLRSFKQFGHMCRKGLLPPFNARHVG